jgi:putative tryptophan/tyrosine transport system substrate-binding protein
MSHGSDDAGLYRLAATYVDRILRGGEPSDIPVQFLVKYELVVNLKTAGDGPYVLGVTPAPRRSGD